MATSLDDLLKSFETSGGAADNLTKALLKLAQSADANASATKAEAEAKARSAKQAETIKAGFTGVVRSGAAVSNGMMSLANSLNSAGTSFTAITPVLDTFETVLLSTTKALADSVKGLSELIGIIPGLGKVVGPAAARLAAAMGPKLISGLKGFAAAVGEMGEAGVQFAFGSAKFLIAGAENVANNFKNLSSVGMIFGGSLQAAKDAATEAGVSLATFTNFATKNAAALAELSGNSQLAAVRIMRMTKNMGDGFLAMYGGFEGLAEAMTDYMALQAKTGMDVIANEEQLLKSSKAYLLTQKELTLLTGKSVETLKKEQEERLKVAAFNTAFGEKSIEEQTNIRNALDQIRAKYGEDAHKYAMELVYGFGKIMSPTGLKFQSMMPMLTNTLRDVMSTTTLGIEEFKESQARIFQNAEPIVGQEMKNLSKQFMGIFAAGYGPQELFKPINDTIVAFQGSVTAQRNAVDNQAEATKNTINVLNGNVGELTKTFETVIRSLEGFKSSIERLIISQAPLIDKIVQLSTQLTEASLKGLETFFEIVDKFLKEQGKGQEIPPNISMSYPDLVKLNAEQLKTLEATIIGKIKETGVMGADKNLVDQLEAIKEILKLKQTAPPATPTPPAAPAQPQPPQPPAPSAEPPRPKMAEGGITTGPSIAGEAGPEAVIPLKSGKIPIDIDMSEMISALNKQIRLSAEVVDQLRRSNDTQERILSASY